MLKLIGTVISHIVMLSRLIKPLLILYINLNTFGRTRTYDRRFRKPQLYPTELQRHYRSQSGNRTHMMSPSTDFESVASTNFAIWPIFLVRMERLELSTHTLKVYYSSKLSYIHIFKKILILPLLSIYC